MYAVVEDLSSKFPARPKKQWELKASNKDQDNPSNETLDKLPMLLRGTMHELGYEQQRFLWKPNIVTAQWPAEIK